MKQAMYCHACNKDFSVDINIQADGNHVFKCPHCQHEHCRVVKNGEITDDRWSQRNGNLGAVYYPVASKSYTARSVYGTGAYNTFLSNSWASTSTAAQYY